MVIEQRLAAQSSESILGRLSEAYPYDADAGRHAHEQHQGQAACAERHEGRPELAADQAKGTERLEGAHKSPEATEAAMPWNRNSAEDTTVDA